jgi:DUF3037 family protein
VVMPSFYTVLQYVPNPTAGERINVGVLAFQDNQVEVRLLHDWRRVTSFGADVKSLRRALDDMVVAIADMASSPGFDALSQIGELAETWRHSVQLTPPVGAHMDLLELAGEAEGLMLKQSLPLKREQARLQIVRRAVSTVGSALKDLEDTVGHALVKQREPISGRYTSHQLDIVVGNGKPFVLAQALSFRKVSPSVVRREVDGTAFMVDDVLGSKGAPNLAVVLGRPVQEARSEYDRAADLFERMHARVVPEAGLRGWAGEVAREMAKAVK